MTSGHRESETQEELPELPGHWIEILRLVANGWGDKQIAREKGMTAPAVRSQVVRIAAWLGAVNRVQAAVIAYRRGYLVDNDIYLPPMRRDKFEWREGRQQSDAA